jgi:RND family efflux transporter MFP subunit
MSDIPNGPGPGEPTTVLDAAPAEAPREHRPRTGVYVAGFGAAVVLTLVGLFTAGTWPRLRQTRELDAAAAEAATAPPRVVVVTARRGPSEADRALPGNAVAFRDTAIYGRTNGYLKRWLVDIGDKVEDGQLLGEIAAPEVDAQLAQAKATLLQSQANLVRAKADEVFAKLEEKRYRQLFETNAGTREDYESRRAASQSASAVVGSIEATIQVNEADIQRFTALVSFQRLTAPFAGVITARTVDPGALITADNPSTERQLFHLSQIDPLRVFVDVPQVFSTQIRTGQSAIAFRREDPSRPYVGKVTRTANSLDPNTRTLRTQVDVPNPTGDLLPGMYLQVKFVFNREVAPIVIPTAAVLSLPEGTVVAVVDGQDTVRYRTVLLGRDYGAEIEVTTGLSAGESVVVRPGDTLPEGTTVRPVPPPTK